VASNITLSAGVRQNLLSLQGTADLMSTTQNRLATGKKVNSALDNPTNFFTSQALQSRAGDMSSLLDNMTSGIKTLEAADNGLSAITKTVESMQSTLRQARQDKSFKTESYTIDTATIGTSTLKNLTLSGGAIGTTGVDVALNTMATGTATPTTLSGAGSTFGTPFADGAISINGTNVNIDGQVAATPTTLRGSASALISGSGGSIDVTVNGSTQAVVVASGDSMATVASKINAVFSSSSPASLDGTTGELVLTGSDGGTVSVYDSVGNGNSTFAFLFPTVPTSSNGTPAADADAASVKANIDAANITGLTVTVNGTNLDLSLASGEDLTITSASSGLLASLGFGTPTTSSSTNGTPQTGAGVKTVDELVSDINSNTALRGKVRASNDSGKLRIENLSTADLDVAGVANGAVDGSGSTTDIGGNTVRSNLVKQFNELRDQLNKLADDASFNGVNLLRGDLLKLTFNETGTSTIEIQAKDETGQERAINTDTLGIVTAEDADFDSDDTIDTLLDGLSGALGTLRSQASSFGSNLSIVENRTAFSKAMINTLQTGADSLVLADTNEEAANMLALQTRQQLSSTALSMASQADQAVLRLF
jgi:flagellin-like hook-associated protein FlgL